MLGKIKYGRNIIWLVILFLPTYILANSRSGPKFDLEYSLNYQNTTQGNCVLVNVDIRGNESGNILLRIPPYANKVAFHTDGKIVYKKIEDQIYQLTLNPNNNLHAEYQACINNPSFNIDYPIFESDFIHFNTGAVLITYESDIEKLRKIKINYDLPKEFSIVSSQNLGNNNEFEQSISEFRNSAIVASTNKIKKIKIKGNPVYIVSKGKWAFFDKEPAYYLEKIIKMQRKFWNDFNFPHYVVVLIQSKASDDEKYVVGTHQANILTMKIPDGDKTKLPVVFRTLSHELFHAWLGMKVKIPLPQGDLQWFFEGVNDYYSLQLLLDNNLLSKQEYFRFYNELLQAYSLSPCIEASNQEVEKYYLLRGPYAQIAEMRGHILFKELSHSLEIKKMPSRKLDLALREIYKTFNKDKNHQINKTELDNIFAKYVGKDNWEKVMVKLSTGKSIELSPDLFGQDVALIDKEVMAPLFGFDVSEFIKSKKIKLLKHDSNAYLAGLRENQEVIDYYLNFNNPNVLSQILVADHKGSRVIQFKPNTTQKHIPQYKFGADVKNS